MSSDASRRLRCDTAGVWPDADSDLDLALIGNANVLIVGPDWRVSAVVSLLVPDSASEGVIQCMGGELRLPSASRETVLLRDVDVLTRADQRRLFQWLGRSRQRRPIVSTASAPLLGRVQGGSFFEELYYRLNTIYIDVST